MPSSPFQHLPIYDLPKATLAIKHGSKQAKILVVGGVAELENSENYDLLQKILIAANIDWQKEVGVGAIPDDEEIDLLRELLNSCCSQIMVFGRSAQSLGLQLKEPINQVFALGDHQYLFTRSLSDIRDNQLHKKNLWEALQIMFDL